MHHTLISDAHHKALHREYHVRLAATVCAALAAAVTVGIVALSPSFLRSSITERVALNAVAVARSNSDHAQVQAYQAELTADGKLLAAVGADREAPRFSDAVAQIVAVRSNILITSMALDRSGASTLVVTIQGVAPTRDELISFQDRLENLAPGATVDLPIQELAKSSDIMFSVKLTEKLP